MDDIDLNLLGRELDERVAEGLNRAVHVALNDDIELLEAAECDTAAHLVKGKHLLGAQTLLALQLLAFVGNLAGLLLGLDHVEGITGLRCAIETEDEHGLGRTGLLDALVTLVEHGFHATEVCTGQYDIAHLERTVLHEYGSHVATALVEGRLDDGTCSTLVGVGLEVEHLGFEQHLLEKVFDTNTGLGRDVLRLVLTAPILYEEVHVGQLPLDLLGVGMGLINLVDGKHHRHACCLSVVDSLLGLGHHVVVGSHDDDGDVGHLGTTGTHGCKGLVTGSVKEGDATAILELHVVGTDVLCDTTSLTGNDV